MRRLFFFSLIFNLHINSIYAQKQIETTNRQWLQYYNNLKINQHWLVQSDIGFRFSNNLNTFSQYLIRASIGYNLGDRNRVALGMAAFQSRGTAYDEFRLHQEFNRNVKYNKLKLQHRWRIEERFFYDQSLANYYNFRFRYRFLNTYEFYTAKIFKQEHQLALNFGDEIFINAGKKIVYNVFDQNRILLGIQLQGKNAIYNLSYANEFRAFNKAATYQQNHILWFGITQNIRL